MNAAEAIHYMSNLNDAAEAIHDARRMVAQLLACSEKHRDLLNQLRAELEIIHRLTHSTKRSEALLRRIERIDELRRMQECGSFSLEAQCTLQELWEKLP